MKKKLILVITLTILLIYSWKWLKWKSKECKKKSYCEEAKFIRSEICDSQTIYEFNSRTFHLVTPIELSDAASIARSIGLANTLMHVKNLHWIIVEINSDICSSALKDLIKRTSLIATHIKVASKYCSDNDHLINMAFESATPILENSVNGVVYFGHVDFVYPLSFFEEARKVDEFPGLVVNVNSDGLTLPVTTLNNVIDCLNIGNSEHRTSFVFPVKDFKRPFSCPLMGNETLTYLNPRNSIVYQTRGKKKMPRNIEDPGKNSRLLANLRYLGISTDDTECPTLTLSQHPVT